MSLSQYSQEQLKEMSFVEVAFEIFSDQKKAIPFKELLSEVASITGVSEDALTDRIAQFYTDLNIDGRFLALSDNTWGLRSWYPYEQLDEETQPTVKAKKRKAKKVIEEDLDLDEFEEVDEDDIDLDDVSDDDIDDDGDDEDDTDFDDEELDDELLEDEDFDDDDDEFLNDDEEDIEDEEDLDDK